MSAATTDDMDSDLLATLTPEEREAMDSSDIRPDDVPALQRIAADAADDDGEDEDDEDDQDDGAPVEGKQAPAADPEPAPPAPAVDAVPTYDTGLPSDFNDKVEAIKSQEAELRQQFKNGDIDLDEFEAKRDELATQRSDLMAQKTVADTLARLNEENRRLAAAQYEQQFVARVRNDGIDYAQAKNQRLFNTFLQDLAEDNPDKAADRDWMWTKAHEAMLRARGLSAAQASADPVAAARDKRKAPVDSAPKTLAAVPGSDGPGDVSSEFAELDRLEGDAYESALAALSPRQREKYLRGS